MKPYSYARFQRHCAISFLVISYLLVGVSRSAALEQPPSTLTLHNVIEIALVNNPGLSARYFEVGAADARHNLAVSSRLPQMNLNGSITQYRDDRLITPRRPGAGDTLQFTDQPLASEVIVQMQLFTGGRLINESRAAALLHDAAEYRFTRSREELVFDVTSIFYSILAQRHTLEAFEFSQEALEGHHKRIIELIHAKKAARVDLLRTEVRLSDLKQRLTQEKNVLAIQNRLLNNLMGAPYVVGENPKVTGQLEFIKETVPNMEQGLKRALAVRSDYLEVKAVLQSKARKVKAVYGLRSPSVALKGAIGNEWDAHEPELNNETGSVMLEVNLPIFSGGYISAKIREEKAVHSVALEKLRQIELQVQLDVEIAYLNINSSYERVHATEKSIEQAKESLRIERERYTYGKGSVTDVLDAQSAFLNAQMNYYRSLADYKTAQAQYQLATGNNL